MAWLPCLTLFFHSALPGGCQWLCLGVLTVSVPAPFFLCCLNIRAWRLQWVSREGKRLWLRAAEPPPAHRKAGRDTPSPGEGDTGLAGP